MEFLRASRRKNLFSESAYVALNLALVVVIFLLVHISDQVLVSLLLVLLSKWRVLAVRIRYWYTNVVANLVDFVVGFGTVGLLYLAGTARDDVALWLQVGVAVLYAAWLILLKPRSGQSAMRAQALTGLFVGTWVVAAFAHIISLPVAVILYYLIGYGAAHHALSIQKEQQPSLLSMVAGLLLAELGWVVYHWTAAYGIAVSGDFKVPQIALVAVLGAMLVERCYAAILAKRSLRTPEYAMPIIFSAFAIIAIVLLFSAVGSGIS